MKLRHLVVAVALVVALGLVLNRVRPPELPAAPPAADGSAGPAFVVQVVTPRSNRPLFGLLPEDLLGLPPAASGFDHTSPGAEVVDVAPDRLALRADGWELVLEVGPDGAPGPGTRVVYTLELAERPRTLCCRPAEGATSVLRTTPAADGVALDGEFLVELAACEDAVSGASVEWPARPLTVRGTFAGLRGPR